MSVATSNLLRLISITAVLFIHASASWESSFQQSHDYFSEDFLAILINQFARFCVPAFVMLSGFGLTKKYMKSEFTLKGFWFGRASRILLPFAVWTLILLLLNNRFAKAENALDVGAILFTYFFKRGADYHFYFFTIILECYLIFPLLYRFRSTALWIGLLLLQIVFTSPSHLFFQSIEASRPSFPASFIIYWAFYFYTGIYLARNEERIQKKVDAMAAWLVTGIALLGFGLVLGEYLTWSNHYAGSQTATPGYYNHFHRQVVIVFALTTMLLFVRFDSHIQAWLDRNPRVARHAAVYSALSFSFYIFHTWSLRLLKMTPLAWEVIVFSLSALAGTFFIFYWINKLLVKPGWLRLVLGLPKDPVSLKA